MPLSDYMACALSVCFKWVDSLTYSFSLPETSLDMAGLRQSHWVSSYPRLDAHHCNVCPGINSVEFMSVVHRGHI